MPGADTTFAQSWTQAAGVMKVLNKVDLWGNDETHNLLDMQDAVVTALDGVYTPGALGVMAAVRARMASVLSADFLRAAWRPFLQEMCRAVGLHALVSGRDVDMLAAIRQHMVDSNLSIPSRAMTFATPSADGGNVGSGTMARVTVDKDGFPLECTGAEAKTATCVRDALTGAQKFAELWRFEGAPGGEDPLYWRGSGLSVEVESAHPLTAQILRNPSFDTNSATADDQAPSSTTTGVSGWTLTSTAAFKLRSAAGYSFSAYPSQPTTGYGLEFVLDGTVSQIIREQNPAARFSRTAPHFVGVRVKRKASATGNLTLRLGAKTTVQSLAGLTNDVWTWVYIALDESCYYQNFNETDLVASVQVATLAVGTVVVDHFTIVELANVDGTYYRPLSGATAHLCDDEFTWTDTEGATRAILGWLLWRAFGGAGWLPAYEDADQVTAAGGRTLTYDQSDKTITASSGSFVTDGFRPGMLLTSAGTTSNNISGAVIASVTATIITLVADLLTDEGPLSATATLDATTPIADPTYP